MEGDHHSFFLDVVVALVTPTLAFFSICFLLAKDTCVHAPIPQPCKSNKMTFHTVISVIEMIVAIVAFPRNIASSLQLVV